MDEIGADGIKIIALPKLVGKVTLEKTMRGCRVTTFVSVNHLVGG